VIEVIEPDTKICGCCNGALHRIGEDVAEALDVVPAIVRVLRTIRPKYASRACETIIQAPARLRLFDGGMATTALVASVAVWKYAWHLPLNRQAQMLAGQGIRLGRATLGKWMKKAAWWLRPLYQLQLEAIHSHPRIYCDETRLPVRKPDQRRTHTGQFWAPNCLMISINDLHRSDMLARTFPRARAVALPRPLRTNRIDAAKLAEKVHDLVRRPSIYA
jgi:transposase